MFCAGIVLFLLGAFTSTWFSKTPITEASTPITYTYSSQGIIPVSTQYGLPLRDAEFLVNFDGPLVDIPYGEPIPDEITLLPTLRASLQAEYEQKYALLQEYFPELSEQRLFLMFLVLRVNGSIPTYEATIDVDWDHNLLVGDKGNCTHYTLRMLMVLNAFELPGRALYIWTPSLPGHVAVEFYDEATGLTALLDANNNLAFFIEGANKPFIDTIGEWSLAERQTFFAENRNQAYAPFMMRYYSPNYWLRTSEFPYSLQELNLLNSVSRVQGWNTTLTTELNVLVSNWDWDTYSRPYNLSVYAGWVGRDFGAVYELDSETARNLIVN